MSRMSKLRARDAARDALKNKKRDQWGCSLVSLLYRVHNPAMHNAECIMHNESGGGSLFVDEAAMHNAECIMHNETDDGKPTLFDVRH